METKTKVIIGASAGAVIIGGIWLIFHHRKPKPLDTPSLQNANKIGLGLGTAYSAIDPRHWTENDEEVEKLILSIPKNQIPQLIKDYKTLFPSQDLVTDLQRLLSGWDNVKYLFSNASGVNKGITAGMVKLKGLKK